MIVYAAITPHPPLSIPAIGGDNLRFIDTTVTSIKKIIEDLIEARPQVILLLSPHGPLLEERFTLNQAEQFSVQFKEFGDLETSLTVRPDTSHIHHYKELLEATHPISLQTAPELDHGCGVPLYYLRQALGKKTMLPIVPVYPAARLDAHKHFLLGKSLQDDIINDTKRIAIIASGDLSHRLSEDAPAGYSHWATKFDETVKGHLLSGNAKGLYELDQDFIDEAGECGLKPMLMLLGIIDNLSAPPQFISYEAPFGVGYLAINYKLI